MMNNWIRVVAKSGNHVIHDVNYLNCKEDYAVLFDDLLSIFATQKDAKIEIEISEFWAPEPGVRCLGGNNNEKN
jgi:hypothetical protein